MNSYENKPKNVIVNMRIELHPFEMTKLITQKVSCPTFAKHKGEIRMTKTS